jgi:hypothetical protein
MTPILQVPSHWAKETQDVTSFAYRVMSGIKGNNTGLKNGLTTINKYIYGTHKGRYYLVGADSGVGKTTLVDFMYVYNAWESAKAENKPITIFYVSLEISRLDKIAKMVSYLLFMHFNLIVSSETILGKIPKHKLSEEELAMVQHCYGIVTDMLKDIIIVENTLTPTEVYENIIDWLGNKGTVLRKPVSAAEKKKGIKGDIIKFIPRNPEEQYLLVTDHIGLLGEEGSTKNTMDAYSRKCIILRNIVQMTIVNIQQFNPDLLSAKRQQLLLLPPEKKQLAIIPTRLDFGDSKAVYRDADVVMGLIKPHLFDLPSFFGINTEKVGHGGFGDYMIAQCLLKNRYGPFNKICPLFVNPISGVFEDIPSTMDTSLHEPYLLKAKEVDKISNTLYGIT